MTPCPDIRRYLTNGITHYSKNVTGSFMYIIFFPIKQQNIGELYEFKNVKVIPNSIVIKVSIAKTT